MQSSGGPAGVELREGGNRLASRTMVEVNIRTASLSNDIDFLCLQVSQNSTINVIPRLYFLNGNESRQGNSLTVVPTKLRGKTGMGSVYRVLQMRLHACHDLWDPLYFDHC